MVQRRFHITSHWRIQGSFKLAKYPIVIDVIQIHIKKLKVQASTIDHYSFKSKAYNMQLQTIVDHMKWFLWGCHVQWMMLVSALIFNISKNMQRLFQWTWHEGIKLNIVGDKGCHLLPWLMLTHKQTDVSHFLLEALYNNQFSCVISYFRIVVENNFDMWKKLFVNWWSSSI